VNLPLLHRLGAGIAKVKMAAKKHHTVHGSFQIRLNDYSNNGRRLASALSGESKQLAWRAGCGNPTLPASTGRRLIQLSRIGTTDARL
jgi:hypothetical protein